MEVDIQPINKSFSHPVDPTVCQMSQSQCFKGSAEQVTGEKKEIVCMTELC